MGAGRLLMAILRADCQRAVGAERRRHIKQRRRRADQRFDLRGERTFDTFRDRLDLVEGVADAAKVSRVGIFSRIRQGDRYRLRAGLRCLPETRELEFGERDPLVRWFELHAHLISRINLTQTDDLAQRAVIRRALDTFGAEVIVPVYARGRIIG